MKICSFAYCDYGSAMGIRYNQNLTISVERGYKTGLGSKFLESETVWLASNSFPRRTRENRKNRKKCNFRVVVA